MVDYALKIENAHVIIIDACKDYNDPLESVSLHRLIGEEY